MAKKNKKRDIKLSPAQMVLPGEQKVEEQSEEATSKAAAPTSQSAKLEEEYHYVIADLKRIGAVSAAMMVLLIALALTLT